MSAKRNKFDIQCLSKAWLFHPLKPRLLHHLSNDTERHLICTIEAIRYVNQSPTEEGKCFTLMVFSATKKAYWLTLVTLLIKLTAFHGVQAFLTNTLTATTTGIKYMKVK